MTDPNLSDVAKPVSTEELLREKEAFNFALFQHNPLPMVVVDAEGQVIKSNLARRNSRDGLPPLGKRLFHDNAGPDEANLHQALLHCIQSGKAKHIPEHSTDGRILSVTLAPFPHGAIVITQDITEHRQAQEQLIQADKMVALGTLVAGVAHEVSNPTNVLLLSASALRQLAQEIRIYLQEQQNLDPDASLGGVTAAEAGHDLLDLVDAITKSGTRIKNTVNELKEFARKDRNELRQEVNVNRMVQGATSLLSPMICKKTHRFSENYAPDLPIVLANAQRLEQVVVNLLTNACQALENPDQPVNISTHFMPENCCIRVDVTDEGKGIQESDLKRIMDPFFTTKHDSGGTGLGLSVSRQIVESFGGRLVFRSEWKKGTTASIYLPFSKEIFQS